MAIVALCTEYSAKSQHRYNMQLHIEHWNMQQYLGNEYKAIHIIQ